MYDLDATSPHTWGRDPSRQLEVAECRYKLFFPIVCGVTRAVQAVLQQRAHVLITCSSGVNSTNTFLRDGA